MLIADDDPSIPPALDLVVESVIGTCRLLHAFDGGSARDLTFRHRPDMVLLDINMPSLSGVEVIEQVSPSFDPDRFLVVTAMTSPEVIERCLSLGVSAVLLKPFKLDQIQDAIKACMGAPLPRGEGGQI